MEQRLLTIHPLADPLESSDVQGLASELFCWSYFIRYFYGEGHHLYFMRSAYSVEVVSTCEDYKLVCTCISLSGQSQRRPRGKMTE